MKPAVWGPVAAVVWALAFAPACERRPGREAARPPASQPAGSSVAAAALPTARAAGQVLQAPAGVEVRGELRLFHKVELLIAGPHAAEGGRPNPFTDYRLAVTFGHEDGQQQIVPGFFAADGHAAHSGATAGNQWAVRWRPDRPGVWTFTVAMHTGTDIALDEGAAGTAVAGVDGRSGRLRIDPSDKHAPDFRARGFLRHRDGEHYLRFSGDDGVYIEGGVDSPENFLAYHEFDNTIDCPGKNSGVMHAFPTHVADFRPGDPLWQNGKGKGIIGAINYLASTGVNALYMVTMSREHNGRGDDNRIFPWTTCDERRRFDVSKLDQWEVVFDHLTRSGLMLHLVTQENENDHLLDGGELGPERKLYYRELIARFAHHPALQWNLGEENVNTKEQVQAFASFFETHDPFAHPKFLHTFPKDREKVYTPLLGFKDLDGPTMQYSNIPEGGLYGETLQWNQRSAAAGHAWVTTATEAAGNDAPLPEDPINQHMRVHWMWANPMAGGGGIEWYLKRKGQGHAFDHSVEDFRIFHHLWLQTGHMARFFRDVVQREGIDLAAFKPANHRVEGEDDWVLELPGKALVVYLLRGQHPRLDLRGQQGSFEVRWFDPRAGGELQSTKVAAVEGGSKVDLGGPPRAPTLDWVVLVRKSGPAEPAHAAK